MTLKALQFEDRVASHAQLISETVWYDDGDGWFLWKDKTNYGNENTDPDYDGGWVLTRPRLGPDIKVIYDSETEYFYISWYEYSDDRHFYTNHSSTSFYNAEWFIWYDSEPFLDTWNITEVLGQGNAELWDEDREEYIGHNWWSKSGDTSIEGRYEARGENRGDVEDEYNGTHKDVIYEIDGYRITDQKAHIAPAGVYEKFERTASVDSDGNVKENVTSDSSDTKVVGVAVFEDGNSNEYIQSVEKEQTSKYTYEYSYGDIHYDRSYGWVIGSPGSGTWWEGSEPDVDNDVTFDEHDEDGATGESKTISFVEYRMGDETTTAYYSDIGLWL